MSKFKAKTLSFLTQYGLTNKFSQLKKYLDYHLNSNHSSFVDIKFDSDAKKIEFQYFDVFFRRRIIYLRFITRLSTIILSGW
jgi:hypothetical protein